MQILRSAPPSLVARIVYLGLPGAGKTTNLQKLHEALPANKRGEVTNLTGFPWPVEHLLIEGGNSGPYTVHYEVLALPLPSPDDENFQAWLTEADVLVFVCDSAPDQLLPTQTTVAALRKLSDDTIPWVVQTNKQDVAQAVSPEILAENLQLPTSTPVIASIARNGEGVGETFVKATRQIYERIQAETRSASGSLASAVPIAKPVTNAFSDHRTKPLPPGADHSQPPLPHAHSNPRLALPPGLADRVLTQIPWDQVQLRQDLMGQSGQADGSGKLDTFIYQAGAWCLKTSTLRRFADEAAVIQEHTRLIFLKGGLEELHPPDTLFIAEPDAEGIYWLWTIMPWLQTLRAALGKAAAQRDEQALGQALNQYAEAVVRALRVTARLGYVLDIHPSNFATAANRLVYIDDEITQGTTVPSVGYALLLRVQEYAQYPAAIAQYLTRFGQSLHTQLKPRELRGLHLEQIFREVPVVTAPMIAAQEQVLNHLATCLEK